MEKVHQDRKVRCAHHRHRGHRGHYGPGEAARSFLIPLEGGLFLSVSSFHSSLPLLPHTFFFFQRAFNNWMYTSKNGNIARKQDKNITPDKVGDRFVDFALKNPYNVEQYVCVLEGASCREVTRSSCLSIFSGSQECHLRFASVDTLLDQCSRSRLCVVAIGAPRFWRS